jgi:hypothetical protein
MIGSFPETRGEWRTYGGGTLLQWSGTFAAPAPPPVLHCQPVSFVRSIPLGAKGRVRDTYADALGATTRVRIRGYFSGSHAAGSYVGNFVLDPRYPCTSLGFWLADLIWRPRYELPSDRPGGKPLTDVEVPVSTPPKGPRAGPEPNTFRCDVRKPHRPYDPCRPYRRRGPGGGRIVWLRWGTTQHGGWGFRHIVARRGFSARTDRYIAATLARGRRDPKDRSRIFRRFKGHGRSCTFRVILGAAAKGIISAYRVDGSKQGNVSGCP